MTVAGIFFFIGCVFLVISLIAWAMYAAYNNKD